MDERLRVTDYGSDEIRPGDLVVYSARRANSVRMTDALVQRIEIRRAGGILAPWLLVRPTGAESGFNRRRTLDLQWVSAGRVRLLRTAEELHG